MVDSTPLNVGVPRQVQEIQFSIHCTPSFSSAHHYRLRPQYATRTKEPEYSQRALYMLHLG